MYRLLTKLMVETKTFEEFIPLVEAALTFQWNDLKVVARNVCEAPSGLQKGFPCVLLMLAMCSGEKMQNKIKLIFPLLNCGLPNVHSVGGTEPLF